MSDVLEPALAPIRAALRRLAVRLDAKPTLRQGTVTSVGPVRVQLDGDTSPTPLTPRLLTPVAPGDRVTVAHTGRDLTIIGIVGGSAVRRTVLYGGDVLDTTPDFTVTDALGIRDLDLVTGTSTVTMRASLQMNHPGTEGPQNLLIGSLAWSAGTIVPFQGISAGTYYIGQVSGTSMEIRYASTTRGSPNTLFVEATYPTV